MSNALDCLDCRYCDSDGWCKLYAKKPRPCFDREPKTVLAERKTWGVDERRNNE